MTDLWVLEWSSRQNAFHIQTAETSVERNLVNMIRDQSTDYITICIGTREECDSPADRFRHYLVARQR